MNYRSLVGGHRKGYMGHLNRIVNHIEECRHRENDSLKFKQIWQGKDYFINFALLFVYSLSNNFF